MTEESTLREDNSFVLQSVNQVDQLDSTPDNIKPERIFGKRHLQVVNTAFLIFVAYFARNSFTVAIIAMNDRNSTINPDIPTYNWPKNIIISAFFVGYVPSQVISSWLITKFGAKWLTVSSIACCSLFGMLIPSVAYWFESKGVIAMRFLQGLSQGCTFPCALNLMGQWVPPNERAVLAGAVYAARPIATIVSMLLSGYIAITWYGWPWIFYISNTVALLWCLSFALFSYDNPANHPTISLRERKYVERSLGQENAKEEREIPWKEILTSAPFWALNLTQAGYSWGFWTQQTQMPMYMKSVMKLRIESSGALSAVPYLTKWLLSYVFSLTSDYLLNKKFWTIDTARKTMNSIGLYNIKKYEKNYNYI